MGLIYVTAENRISEMKEIKKNKQRSCLRHMWLKTTEAACGKIINKRVACYK